MTTSRQSASPVTGDIVILLALALLLLFGLLYGAHSAATTWRRNLFLILMVFDIVPLALIVIAAIPKKDSSRSAYQEEIE